MNPYSDLLRNHLRRITILPDDYARCSGSIRFAIGVGSNTSTTGYVLKKACVDCLRRTAPIRDNVLYSYMTPPDFTATCPERIAP